MKGYHDIYIIEVDGEYRVRPAVWSTDADWRKGRNIILFRNFTSYQVEIELPGEIVRTGQANPLTLQPARQQGSAGHIALNAGTRISAGAYPYRVTVKREERNQLAKGQSEPIIIIDPPPQGD